MFLFLSIGTIYQILEYLYARCTIYFRCVQSKRGCRRLYFKRMYYNLWMENDKFPVLRTFFLFLTLSFCLRLFFSFLLLEIYIIPFRTVFGGVHFGSALLSDLSEDVKELKTNWLYFSNANKTHKYQKHSVANSLLNWMFWILNFRCCKLRKSSFLSVSLVFFIQYAHIFSTYIAYFTIKIMDNSVRGFVYDVHAFFFSFKKKEVLLAQLKLSIRLVHLVCFVVQKYVSIVFVRYHTKWNAWLWIPVVFLSSIPCKSIYNFQTSFCLIYNLFFL